MFWAALARWGKSLLDNLKPALADGHVFLPWPKSTPNRMESKLPRNWLRDC
jgi:hypothetical protein